MGADIPDGGSGSGGMPGSSQFLSDLQAIQQERDQLSRTVSQLRKELRRAVAESVDRPTPTLLPELEAKITSLESELVNTRAVAKRWQVLASGHAVEVEQARLEVSGLKSAAFLHECTASTSHQRATHLEYELAAYQGDRNRSDEDARKQTTARQNVEASLRELRAAYEMREQELTVLRSQAGPGYPADDGATDRREHQQILHPVSDGPVAASDELGGQQLSAAPEQQIELSLCSLPALKLRDELVRPPSWRPWHSAWSPLYARWYWWHELTNETSWDWPEEVLLSSEMRQLLPVRGIGGSGRLSRPQSRKEPAGHAILAADEGVAGLESIHSNDRRHTTRCRRLKRDLKQAQQEAAAALAAKSALESRAFELQELVESLDSEFEAKINALEAVEQNSASVLIRLHKLESDLRAADEARIVHTALNQELAQQVRAQKWLLDDLPVLNPQECPNAPPAEQHDEAQQQQRHELPARIVELEVALGNRDAQILQLQAQLTAERGNELRAEQERALKCGDPGEPGNSRRASLVVLLDLPCEQGVVSDERIGEQSSSIISLSMDMPDNSAEQLADGAPTLPREFNPSRVPGPSGPPEILSLPTPSSALVVKHQNVDRLQPIRQEKRVCGAAAAARRGDNAAMRRPSTVLRCVRSLRGLSLCQSGGSLTSLSCVCVCHKLTLCVCSVGSMVGELRGAFSHLKRRASTVLLDPSELKAVAESEDEMPMT